MDRKAKCDGNGAVIATFTGKATKYGRTCPSLLPGFKEVINPHTWSEIKELDCCAPVAGMEEGMTLAPDVPKDERRAWVKDWLTSAKDYGKRVEEYEQGVPAAAGHRVNNAVMP